MKEISQELLSRDVVICVTCGAILEGVKFPNGIDEPCPECEAGGEGSSKGLYWVEPCHSWTEGLRNNDD